MGRMESPAASLYSTCEHLGCVREHDAAPGWHGHRAAAGAPPHLRAPLPSLYRRLAIQGYLRIHGPRHRLVRENIVCRRL